MALESVPTVMLLTPARETLWRRSGLFRREEMDTILKEIGVQRAGPDDGSKG